jgi:hypothetical protein
MEEKIQKLAIAAQRTEITEHHIYYKLAQTAKIPIMQKCCAK